MPVTVPGLRRGWTLADLDGLPDDTCRYELVDGALLVTPPPSQHHQEIGHALRERLDRAAPPGWRVRGGYPLPFASDRQRQPDVVVFRWPLRAPREDVRSPLGPADVALVVEVVSPHTRRTDRFAKPGEYAEAGIAIFWRVETEPDITVQAYVLRGAGYEVDAGAGLPVPWGRLAIDVSTLG